MEDLGIKMLAVKAEPDIFWQERQWHTTCWKLVMNAERDRRSHLHGRLS